MAWYEAHQTMARHPKTLKLARLLKMERRYAVGLLHDLFSWALDVAGKNGKLSDLCAEDIAVALDFSGKKGAAVVAALVESGYLEMDGNQYRVHDWYDYAGKLMDRREADKTRKEETRKKKNRKSTDCPQEVQRTESGNPYATVPNRTLPYQEELNISKTSTFTPLTNSARAYEHDDGFERFWAAFPKKAGDIKACYLEYLHALDTGSTLETMLAALEWQREEWKDTETRYIPSPQKWLENKAWTQEKGAARKKGGSHDEHSGNSGKSTGESWNLHAAVE